MTEPLQIIANPNSAGGKGARVLPGLEKLLTSTGIPYYVHATRAPGHGAELAAELTGAGVSRILAVGGDGTIHEVANGILRGGGSSPVLAVLPVGTGNDFHRMLHASGRLDELPFLFETGEVREFEVGRVRWDEGEAIFVNLLGVGIDVAVLQRRDGFGRLPGLLQYLAAFASAMRTFSALPLRIEVTNGESSPRMFQADFLLAAVTVGPSVGGGFLLSPDALPDDGFLDFFHAERMSALEVGRYLPGVLRGTSEESPRIHRGKLVSARMEAADGGLLTFELDGEVMPIASPFLEIDVNPVRLRILDLPGVVS